MKKFCFASCAVIIFAFSMLGCSHKKRTLKLSQCTTTIQTPPDLISPNHGAAGNITVTIPTGGNHVLISVLFAGTNTQQTVTVNGHQVGNSAAPGTWMSVEYDYSGQYNVTANRDPGAAYPNVVSKPIAGGQPNVNGFDVTAYSDTSGNKAVVAIMDLEGAE